MFDNFSIDLQSLNFSTVVFRVVLSVLLSGLIGMERDIKHRSAGLRTHMLVSLGATIIMITNEYIYYIYPEAQIDITRMGAQVVSGIGFIGAGTILVTSDNRVKGLTTAAGLWVAAAIGMAVGIGYYELAILSAITVLIIVTFLRPVKRAIQSRVEVYELTLLIFSQNGVSGFLEYTADHNIRIMDIDIEHSPSQDDEDDLTVLFKTSVDLGNDMSEDEFIDGVKNIPGIHYAVSVSD